VVEADVVDAIMVIDSSQPVSSRLPSGFEDKVNLALISMSYLQGEEHARAIMSLRRIIREDLKTLRLTASGWCHWCLKPAYKILDHFYCSNCNWNHPALCIMCRVKPIILEQSKFYCLCGWETDLADVIVFRTNNDANFVLEVGSILVPICPQIQWVTFTLHWIEDKWKMPLA
jgi:hypothetical protein